MKPHTLVAIACPIFSMCHVSAAYAQPATNSPKFDVVSIKLTRPDSVARTAGSPSPNTFTISGLQLKHVISLAYGVRPYQVSGGPGWVDSQPYDIVGKVEEPIGKEEFPRMLQQVLSDRFALKLRRETRPKSVYVLAVDKAGPKMAQSKPGTAYSKSVNSGRLSYTRASIESFTMWISGELGKTVVDTTGLGGHFDFSLEWSPDRVSPPDGPTALSSAPSLFRAVREQLGLQLELRNMPIEFLLIEEIQRPSEN